MEFDDKEALDYNFGVTSAHFTERDFVIMMRLKFTFEFMDYNVCNWNIQSHHICTKYLKNNLSLDKEALGDLFENYHYRDDKDAVKMALLDFLNLDSLDFRANTNST